MINEKGKTEKAIKGHCIDKVMCNEWKKNWDYIQWKISYLLK